MRARRGTRAAACATLVGKREFKRPFAAEERLLEIDLQLHRHVRSALGRVRVGRAPPAAEHAAEAETAAAHRAAEDGIEDVAEIDILEVREVAAEIEAARAELHALMAELVIPLALLRIGQHLVRLGGLLKLGLRRFVARIAVRVIFHRQLAVGGLDLVRARRLGDAQHLVIVSLLRHI